MLIFLTHFPLPSGGGLVLLLLFAQAVGQMLINLVRSDKPVYIFVNYEDQEGPAADMKRV